MAILLLLLLLLQTLLTQLRSTVLFELVREALKPLRAISGSAGASNGAGSNEENQQLLAMWLARPLADEMATLLVFVLQPSM